MRTISNIVVDIETIPGLDKPGPDDISVPANYKNPEVIEKYRTDPDRINELWIKQSLDFIRGRIHTIAWKINDEPTQSIWHDGTDEEGLLKRFEQALLDTFKEHYGNDTMYGVTWVGHNIKRFDMPFIWLRARKYKCEKLIKMLGESPRDVKMEDTMLWVTSIATGIMYPWMRHVSFSVCPAKGRWMDHKSSNTGRLVKTKRSGCMELVMLGERTTLLVLWV
jgi:DNA polymerase elongation subunit (family B)